MYDNKATILYKYYKNGNGEGYTTLPRRFMKWQEGAGAQPWNLWDNEANGRPYFNKNIPYISGSETIDIGGHAVEETYFVKDDYFYNIPPATESETLGYKLKNDNSRFQIFIKADSRYGTQTDADYNKPIANAPKNISIAEQEYHEYVEKLDIEVNIGFSSPSSIAEKITSKLKSTQPPVVRSYHQNVNGSNLEIPLSVENNSNFYHTFFSSNFKNQSHVGFSDWNNRFSTDSAIMYEASFQYIGVKRPKLWIEGRALANSLITKVDVNGSNLGKAGWHLYQQITEGMFQASWDGLNNNTIVLNQEWDLDTLNLMRNLFNEQGNHSELFTNERNYYRNKTTKDNSRFLHINGTNASAKLDATEDFNNHEYLGNDYTFDNVGAGITEIYTSKPLFFDYNPEFKNIYTEGSAWESGYCYGFAKKIHMVADGKDYIGLTTRNLGFTGSNLTIPQDYFTFNNGSLNGSLAPTRIEPNTLIGYDVHFSAYGTSAICITDGYAEADYDALTTYALYEKDMNASRLIPVSRYAQQSYLGADNPLLNFNNISSRFEWSQLHTAERIGNKSNAGSINASGGTSIIPLNPDASDLVYKINKRLLNNNWTPSMMPYGTGHANASLNGTEYDLSLLNPQIQAWAIFDSHSGVIINDFGFTETTWPNSLWGILGFTYNQFNTQNTEDNDITTRVGDSNSRSLPFAMTNAYVNAGDSLNYMTNIFGANNFTNQIPLPNLWNGSHATAIEDPSLIPGNYINVYPAISEIQQSVTLSAPNLPRKMLRPYYCIRSDIVDRSQYIGSADSGQLLPVVAIVNKINGDGDFYFQEESVLEFTFTKSKTISSITTSIHDPNQSYANVNNDSAVIYKISKNIQTQFNIAEQILKEK